PRVEHLAPPLGVPPLRWRAQGQLPVDRLAADADHTGEVGGRGAHGGEGLDRLGARHPGGLAPPAPPLRALLPAPRMGLLAPATIHLRWWAVTERTVIPRAPRAPWANRPLLRSWRGWSRRLSSLQRGRDLLEQRLLVQEDAFERIHQGV